MNKYPLNEFVNSLHNKTVTLIYNYSNVRRLQHLWYDKWNSDVIMLFATAIEKLGANVRYLDIDSYLKVIVEEKEFVGDYLINLHTGIKDISIWPMIPSLASWRNIPIAPCFADAHIVNGRKDVTNAIIRQTKLLSPEQWSTHQTDNEYIIKPRDLGCSIETTISKNQCEIEKALNKGWIVEKFIKGTEIVIGVIALPNNEYEVLGAHKFVIKNSKDPNSWIYTKEIKIQNGGDVFDRVPIILENKLIDELKIFAKKLGSSSTFRIDARIETNSTPEKNITATLDNCYILEVNETPDPSPNGGYIKLWNDNYKKLLKNKCCQIDKLESEDNSIKSHMLMVALQLYYSQYNRYSIDS